MSTNSLFLDIETVAAQNHRVREAVANHAKLGNLKDPVKIEAKRQAAIEATGVRPEGEIIAIGSALNDDPVSCAIRLQHEDERGLLSDFIGWLHALNEPGKPFRARIVGHKVIDFDIPRLWQRAKVHGLSMPQWWPGPWKAYKYHPVSDQIMDTMYAFSIDPMLSQDTLAAMLGIAVEYPTIKGADGGEHYMTGADVKEQWESGQYGVIKTYCSEDVRVVREIARRLAI